MSSPQNQLKLIWNKNQERSININKIKTCKYDSDKDVFTIFLNSKNVGIDINKDEWPELYQLLRDSFTPSQDTKFSKNNNLDVDQIRQNYDNSDDIQKLKESHMV